MSRYADIADVLRQRIDSGEYPVGSRLPGITTLQEEFDVPGLGTIRAAQQRLVQEGLLRTQQGVGAFVISNRPAEKPVDALALLETARADLTRAIAVLRERAGE